MGKKKKRTFLRARFLPDGSGKTPFYNDKADYNTNSSSFYDYLGKFNFFLKILVDFVNRLIRRDVIVENTTSIELIKEGQWIGDEDGQCEIYDDEIKLKANVIISKNYTENYTSNFDNIVITIPNGTKIVSDGVWSPDYRAYLDHQFNYINNKFNEIDQKITNLENKIDEINNRIDNLEQKVDNYYNEFLETKGGLQKIINNLYSTGAITTNNINTYEFITGRNIASGTINLFATSDQGNYYIRTNSGATQNDLIAGIGV